MLIYMPTVEILNSHPVSVLRKEIAKANDKLGIIKGYSKGMKKADIIVEMMKHKSRFHHIKMAEKKVRGPKKIKVDVEKAKKAGIKVDEEKAKKAGIKIKKPKKEQKEKPAPKKQLPKIVITEEEPIVKKKKEKEVKADKMEMPKTKNKIKLPKKIEPKKAVTKVKAGKVTPKSSDLKELEKSINKPSKKSLIEQLDELPDHPDAKEPKKEDTTPKDTKIIIDIIKGKKPIEDLTKTSNSDFLEDWKDTFAGKTIDKVDVIKLLQPYEYNELSDMVGLNGVFKLLGKIWDKVKKNKRKTNLVNNDKTWLELFKKQESYLVGLDDIDSYTPTITGIGDAGGDSADYFIKKYYTDDKKEKKPRSEKQKENDKKIGEAAKARAAAKGKK